jgi:hypothetical protein
MLCDDEIAYGRAVSLSLVYLGLFDDKAAHDFNHPADMAAETEPFVWMPCERCWRQAKLHLKRELKPLQ